MIMDPHLISLLPPVELASEYVIKTYEDALQSIVNLDPSAFQAIAKGLTFVKFTNFKLINNVLELERLYQSICEISDIAESIMEAAILKLYACHDNIALVTEKLSMVLSDSKSRFSSTVESAEKFNWKELLNSEPWLVVCLLIKIGRPIQIVSTLSNEDNDGDLSNGNEA